jgi:transposase
MGRRLPVREVRSDERQAVARLAHSRTAPARAVERARVVVAALKGQMVEEIAAEQHLSRDTAYRWLHRCEDRGLAGLEDRARGGRPRTDPGEQVGALVATALTKPKT